MRVLFGDGETEYGPGVRVVLEGGELASAIHLWLYSQGVFVTGPRTTTISGLGCLNVDAEIYVDPTGSVMHNGVRFTGRGKTE